MLSDFWVIQLFLGLHDLFVSSVIIWTYLVFYIPFFQLPSIFLGIKVFYNSSFHFRYLSISFIVSASSEQFDGQSNISYLFFLESKILPTIFSSTTIQRDTIFVHSDFLVVQFSQPHRTSGGKKPQCWQEVPLLSVWCL